MATPMIEVLDEQDRHVLIGMLSAAVDFSGPIDAYRSRTALPDTLLVAWVDQRLVGMSNANYAASLGDKRDFDPFGPPSGPHAFLDRIYVAASARQQGVGRALLEASIQMARDNGCNFAGGFIDARSDPTGRVRFFQKTGFQVRDQPGEMTIGMLL